MLGAARRQRGLPADDRGSREPAAPGRRRQPRRTDPRGSPDLAQQALDEGLRTIEDTSQRVYIAEHHRLQAELHVAGDEDTAAEAEYRGALRAAAGQGARWLALRAARGLANLLSLRGRAAEARAVLEPAVAAIDEGHDTLDYVCADGLLRNV